MEVFPVLVLSRKKDESIWIDDRIRVVVLGVDGNRVRLGIEAPRDVPVMRSELDLPRGRSDAARDDASKLAANDSAGET